MKIEEKIDQYLNEEKTHKITLNLTDSFIKDLRTQIAMGGPFHISVDDMAYLCIAIEYGIRKNKRELNIKSSLERNKK